MLDVTTKPLLEIKDVCQRYRTGSGEEGALVLDHVSLTLNEGEIVALLGRSGCGKSSLLRIISGLVAPAEGDVRFHGQPVDGPVEGVAMVFQSAALFPWLTVLANVELGLRAKKISEAESRHARAEGDRPYRPRRLRNRPFRRSSRAACASAWALPARSSSTPISC